MRIFCLVLTIALCTFAASAHAQTTAPTDRKEERIIAGAVMLASFATLPPLIGIAIGLARPGGEYNVPFGIALAGVSIVGISTSAWSIVDAMRPRAIPTVTPIAQGVMVGVVGAF